MSPITLALDHCQNPTNPNKIPCLVVSTWEYTDCNSTLVNIYNSSGDLFSEKNFTIYKDSGRCNFTWNISTTGSYIWNVTNGDTGRLVVEVDEKMNIALAIVFSVFAFLFMIGGAYLFFKRDNSND